MQNTQPSLFARDDTFFGVCQGLGEDLGISPNLLRLALVPALFFNPVATIGGYAAAGLLVLLSRKLFPNPRVTEAPVAAEPATVEAEVMPLAA